MQQTPTLLIGLILGLTLLFLIVFAYLTTRDGKNNSNCNYKSIFMVGVTWLPLGIAVDVITFSILGLIFLIIGIINKDKWNNEKNNQGLGSKSKMVLFIIFVILLFVGVLNLSNKEKQNNSNDLIVNDFNSCVEAGNPVMESYPRQCSNGEGHFVENIGNMFEVQDLIELNSIRPNEKISSPLILEGQARGTWYFEGSFPVILTDWDGLIIAQGYVTAQSDWMTEDFVQFKGELEFIKPEYGENGSLILQKDNPSGLSEYDNALEIPILFK
ncbi:Gmad2 immunoglobulin-like domain-containing protein [Patescibacteria group bacterium]|nr:Gmad2 immunoglobulin-like domain-containing protein [Patescibacteria group bacterium]